MLNITETHATMGKLSNNLEKHGEEDVTAFDIPIDGITLRAEQVNALVEDPYADRWLFNDAKDVKEPNLAKFEPLVMSDAFEGALVSLTMSTGQLHTFADCKIKGVTLQPRRGGDTLVGFSLRLRPENEQQILDLIDHQNATIKIDVQEAKVALKGGRKQQELPLQQGDDSGEAESAEVLTFEGGKRKRGKKPNGEAHA